MMQGIGDLEMTGPTPADFWARTLPVEGGCWEWQGAIVAAGYGRCLTAETPFPGMYSAHRVAYTIVKGTIPDGLAIDHLCRNRRCVNPDHLEAVTLAENIARGVQARNGHDATHCKNGHEYTPENTYWCWGGRRCKTCVKAYNAEYHKSGRRRRR